MKTYGVKIPEDMLNAIKEARLKANEARESRRQYSHTHPFPSSTLNELCNYEDRCRDAVKDLEEGIIDFILEEFHK